MRIRGANNHLHFYFRAKITFRGNYSPPVIRLQCKSNYFRAKITFRGIYSPPVIRLQCKLNYFRAKITCARSHALKAHAPERTGNFNHTYLHKKEKMKKKN